MLAVSLAQFALHPIGSAPEREALFEYGTVRAHALAAFEFL
jgi:hypothetical protein